jgi:hypothetical protein
MVSSRFVLVDKKVSWPSDFITMPPSCPYIIPPRILPRITEPYRADADPSFLAVWQLEATRVGHNKGLCELWEVMRE